MYTYTHGDADACVARGVFGVLTVLMLMALVVLTARSGRNLFYDGRRVIMCKRGRGRVGIAQGAGH
eukprot:8629351-Pyramimonas_sp.AAC.1